MKFHCVLAKHHVTLGDKIVVYNPHFNEIYYVLCLFLKKKHFLVLVWHVVVRPSHSEDDHLLPFVYSVLKMSSVNLNG